MVIPGNQGGGNTTLELPATAPSHQLAPQLPPSQPPEQELVIPKRQLRDQPGYQQVTVTVTDPNGSYVTDLQKQDFKLYMDGQQRPIEFFAMYLNTPVSVGILVDTSGSMQPKLPQARAAITEFLRNLNDRDDVFLFAFSGKPFMLQSFTTDHSLVERSSRSAARLWFDLALRRNRHRPRRAAARTLRQAGIAGGYRRNG